MHVNKKENQNKNPGCNSLWLLCPGFLCDSIYNASDRIQRESVL